MTLKQIYLFLLTGAALAGCTNTKHPDVSNVQADIKIERFDQELSALTPRNLSAKAPLLKRKYDPFYEDFASGMLGAGNTSDTAYYAAMRTILKNRDYLELRSAVASRFPSMQKTEEDLTDAFRHVRYYYPKQKLPRLITFFSGFAVQTPIGNDYIGIGLDMFLGADSKFYPALRQSIPLYISKKFTPENITPRVMEAFIREDMFPEPDQSKSLLEKMVYNGKILYFMNAVMPDAVDSVNISYTAKQFEWCEKYEADIWAYFLQNNLLYESDYMKIQKYLTDAPFTPGLGEGTESAPKLGVWTGWQIVKKYMDKNPGVTVQQLMKMQDAQAILNGSRYRPR